MASSRPAASAANDPHLTAALHDYLVWLDELAACPREAILEVLHCLASAMRDVHAASLDAPCAASAFIALLVGHAELVAYVCKEGDRRTPPASLLFEQMRRAQAMFGDAQRRR